MDSRNFFNKVEDTVYKAAEVTSKKAKQISEITKLNFDCARKRDVIKQAKIEIGDRLYKELKDNPPENYEELFAKISLAEAEIAENMAKIAELKGRNKDTD
ncbi:MAG: hypothetical protein ACOX7P_06380 [Oscillospiraceae bacterium]|jgi:hypothetical protein